MFGWIRAVIALLLVAIVTAPMALAQVFIMKTGIGNERTLPIIWHRFILRILDIRLHIRGEMATERPLLMVANHVSWTDIMVGGAIGRINFVSKSEVSGWPMIGPLAKLQRTVFVERDRKRRSGDQVSEIAQRLAAGDPMFLFAEGITADGNLMLPFKSTLFGAATVTVAEGAAESVAIQPVALVYTRLHGMPMQRQHRVHAAWIGDRILVPHILALLREGAMDVEVHLGEPVIYRAGSDRKAVAREVERRVQHMFLGALRQPLPNGRPRKRAVTGA